MATVPNPEAVSGRPTTSAPTARRSLMIDIVKGMAITLVTMGHTNQGMIHRNWWASEFGYRLDNFIYAFHMPAFFFVSGIFLCSSLEKRGIGRYTATKLETILYPFEVWHILVALTAVLLGRFMQSERPPLGEYLLGFVTGNQEWFLPTLLFVLLLGAVLRKIPIPVLFVLSLAASYFWRSVNVAFLDRGITEFPFLVAGMWVGPRFAVIERVPVWASLVLAVGLGVGIYYLTPSELYPVDWRYVPVGLLGTLMLMLVGNTMGQGWLGRGFAWIGVASLGVFLLSGYGQGLGRQLLLAAHIRNNAAQLLFPTLMATLPAAWVYQRRAWLHVDWLFVWPFGKRQNMPKKA
jgi:fucose 4-O-acetylase-like acetyltransferase